MTTGVTVDRRVLPPRPAVQVALRTARQVGPVTALSELSNVVKIDLK